MNLGKLLGVGKSFFGAEVGVTYRVNRSGLPKFNEGRNPFAPKTAESETTMTKTDNQAEPPAPMPMPATATVAKPETQPPAPKAPARLSFAAKAPAPAPAKPTRSAWTTRLNPFRPPQPEPAALAEQTELSLDAIKVVHNDLADADVDVVPVKSHTEAPVPAAVLPPARQAWEYMGENMMKAR